MPRGVRIPTETIIGDLKACADAIGKPPTVKEYQEWSEFSCGPAIVRFGSWNDALKAAGLEVNRRTPVTV